jgi:hypothetical protein
MKGGEVERRGRVHQQADRQQPEQAELAALFRGLRTLWWSEPDVDRRAQQQDPNGEIDPGGHRAVRAALHAGALQDEHQGEPEAEGREHRARDEDQGASPGLRTDKQERHEQQSRRIDRRPERLRHRFAQHELTLF